MVSKPRGERETDESSIYTLEESNRAKRLFGSTLSFGWTQEEGASEL